MKRGIRFQVFNTKTVFCSYGTNSLIYYRGMLKIQYFQDLHSNAIYSAKIGHFSDNAAIISVMVLGA